MKKYQSLVNDDKCGLRRGMIFEWDRGERCYTTKELPWFLTPLIEKSEMKDRIKWKQFSLKNKK